MQFNTKSSFCPKQNLFSFEKYAELHMLMNDMMYEELGCYTEEALKKLFWQRVHLLISMYPKKSNPLAVFSFSLRLGLQNQQGEVTELSQFPLKNFLPHPRLDFRRSRGFGIGGSNFCDKRPLFRKWGTQSQRRMTL
jgi:hypothetical protein